MRKNKTMRLASCLLAVTLLTTCAISGTFAKYTSSATGSDVAEVATWNITVNDVDITDASGATKEVSFGLFDTINEEDTITAEKNVISGRIAPGTGGSFALEIENNSEVGARYTIRFKEFNNSNVPILYSLDNENWVDNLADINTQVTDKFISRGGVQKTATIYWKWMYSSENDVNDTAIGIAAATAKAGEKDALTGAPYVGITAGIVVTQVD